MSMTPLLDEVSRLHIPNAPATPAQIEAFEKAAGWTLDPDLRAFYLHCDGAILFERHDPAYRFLPLKEIRRGRVVILKDDTDKAGPADWYSICEVRESNYILLDVSHQENGCYPIRDGFREMFPAPDYCPQIAASFGAFLAGALRSKGRWFWLQP
ncbi:SMI1/KNR4 family protein [Corallococcus terminator]